LFSEKEETMTRPASRVCRVLMTGPLASFVAAYAAELRERGYTPLTTVVELRGCPINGGFGLVGLVDSSLERYRERV
jgi:hypothetical protein